MASNELLFAELVQESDAEFADVKVGVHENRQHRLDKTLSDTGINAFGISRDTLQLVEMGSEFFFTVHVPERLRTVLVPFLLIRSKKRVKSSDHLFELFLVESVIVSLARDIVRLIDNCADILSGHHWLLLLLCLLFDLLLRLPVDLAFAEDPFNFGLIDRAVIRLAPTALFFNLLRHNLNLFILNKNKS